MKTLISNAFAALLLVWASTASMAAEKNTAQIKAANTNTQIIVRHLTLKFRAYQVNQ
jgi:hypothetical protein